MAKETMKLGEGFQASVIPGTSRAAEVKPRHRVIGYGSLLALLSALVYFLTGHSIPGQIMQEKPGIIESLGTKIGGKVSLDHVRAGAIIGHWELPNQVVNAGETALRDCFGGTGTPTCTTVQNFKYHGLGTSSAVIAEGDTGCTTELTTQYAVDNTRPTGSQTNNGANVYRTVATNTVDASVTINEFCLMSQAATGGGTMWTRILTGAVTLASGDSLVTTYDLTIE